MINKIFTIPEEGMPKMNNNDFKVIFTTKEENGVSDMNRAFQNFEKICNHYGFTIEDIKIVKIKENKQ